MGGETLRAATSTAPATTRATGTETAGTGTTTATTTGGATTATATGRAITTAGIRMRAIGSTPGEGWIMGDGEEEAGDGRGPGRGLRRGRSTAALLRRQGASERRKGLGVWYSSRMGPRLCQRVRRGARC